MNTVHPANKQQGFTLIELSIVLVIIGLIVGGILVGQDLIKAAEIRATVSQLEKYNTSVNTFRNKYGYIPGDLPMGTNSAASNLGFHNETTLGGTVGHGDGNTLVEGGSAGAVVGLGETLGFWRHLTDAQMIDGNFGTTTAGNLIVVTTGAATSAVTAGTVGNLFPGAKLGRGNYIVVYANSGFNYFQITGITAMTTAGAFTLTTALTPIESSNIDQKTDDGLPLAGNVRAMVSTTTLNTASAASDNCTNASSLYDIDTTDGNAPRCQLRLRFN